MDLGDGKYEFCFNFSTETKDEHLSYVSDVVTIEGSPDKANIITALIKDGRTEIEANELTKGLVI